MLQQTTVAAVHGYFLRFIARWPDVFALAQAKDADVMGEWAGLGYYARALNLLKCARVIVNDHGAIFPNDYRTLITLPGIGPYTGAAIASIAFDQPEAVVDGNVERVMARVFQVETPLPTAKPELVALAKRLTPANRPGDYAQAVMDLGATICTPKSPTCGLCPWAEPCVARKNSMQSTLPRRLAKKPKPTRLGVVYLARREDGAWLLERRPDKGLLGGMLGWPGAEWSDVAREAPPMDASWQEVPETVRHTFTHFHLILSLRIAIVHNTAKPKIGHFVPADQFKPSQLPTAMRKAYELAAPEFSSN